jgi:hypothetical protein
MLLAWQQRQPARLLFLSQLLGCQLPPLLLLLLQGLGRGGGSR